MDAPFFVWLQPTRIPDFHGSPLPMRPVCLVLGYWDGKVNCIGRNLLEWYAAKGFKGTDQVPDILIWETDDDGVYEEELQCGCHGPQALED